MPLSLTLRGWGLLALASLLGLGAGLAGLRDLWHAAALLLALVIVGTISAITIPLRNRYTIRLRIDDPTPTAGQTVNVRLLREPAARRTGALRIILQVGASRITLSVAAGTAQTPVTVSAAARGPLLIRVRALIQEDPLGLAQWRRTRGEQLHLLVLPRTIDALAEVMTPSTAAAGPECLVPVSTGTPSGALRAYQHGDPPRRIHWKQSARQGLLLAALFEEPHAHRTTIQLLTNRESYVDDQHFEEAVSATATAAVFALRHAETVILLLTDGIPRQVRNESEALRLLAEVGRSASNLQPFDAPRPDILVSGTLPALMHQSGESGTDRSSSLFILVNRGDPAAPLPGWQLIDLVSDAAEARGSHAR